jgi:leader peptidase (prepilin peptidase)/N-methyltransferase
MIDLQHQILPDSVNIYLACLFLMVSVTSQSWKYWLFGGAIGVGFPLLVTWMFYKLRGQIGLGGGDIKLYGALGLYLGPLGIIHNIFLSCFLGAIIGLFLIGFKVIKKENPIPFGPFILIISLIQIFFADWFEHLTQYIS